MNKKIEKERKWLLKRVPHELYDYPSLSITQFYTGDGWRYRETINLEDSNTKYEKLRKISTGLGINQEVDIEDIDRDTFYDKLDSLENPKVIRKERFLVGYEGKTLEVDEFVGMSLCIMEVEDVEMSDKVEFPDWIQKNILMEVTGNPAFNNSNLGMCDEL